MQVIRLFFVSFSVVTFLDFWELLVQFTNLDDAVSLLWQGLERVRKTREDVLDFEI